MRSYFIGDQAKHNKENQANGQKQHRHRPGISQSESAEPFIDHHRGNHGVVGHNDYGAKLAHAAGKHHHKTRHHAAPGQGQRDAHKNPEMRGAQVQGSFFEPYRYSGESIAGDAENQRAGFYARTFTTYAVLGLEPDEEDEYHPADVNRDGKVDALDLQLVQNAVMGIPIDPSYDPDVNGDGEVNALDIQFVINVILGRQ